jgi:hypothetical protein
MDPTDTAITYWYSKEQSQPWEAGSNSAVQKIFPILWDRKFDYLVHNAPSLGPVVSQRFLELPYL